MAACKLDYLLESMQPYPGNPSNVLQYKGHRFFSCEIVGGNLCLWHLALEREMIISIEIVEQSGFAAGLWYALDCSEKSRLPITRLSWYKTTMPRDVWAWNTEKVLEAGAPYIVGEPESQENLHGRFKLTQQGPGTNR